MAVKMERMEQEVTTGHEAISGVFPMLSFIPLLTGPHLRVAKVLLDCLVCNCVGTTVAFVLAILEMFLRNPAVGATLVGMHIFSGPLSFDFLFNNLFSFV